MEIFPAIDILDGKAVRLLRGDYDAVTVYGDDPVEIGKRFAAEGARCVHMVDLGGAREGHGHAFDVICKVKAETGLFCEVGGGIRDMDAVDKYIGAGLDRVIIGTAALKDRDFVLRAVDKYGPRIAVGVDARGGCVATDGWTVQSEVSAIELCQSMAEAGVKTFICTDIAKDGAMAGTNREFYAQLVNEVDADIIASGGVGSADDVKYLAGLGVAGAIIGKAYYTGAIGIREAMEAARI